MIINIPKHTTFKQFLIHIHSSYHNQILLPLLHRMVSSTQFLFRYFFPFIPPNMVQTHITLQFYYKLSSLIRLLHSSNHNQLLFITPKLTVPQLPRLLSIFMCIGIMPYQRIQMKFNYFTMFIKDVMKTFVLGIRIAINEERIELWS